MKYWSYSEPHYDASGKLFNVVVTKSEDEILDEYYEYFISRMKRVNKEDLISKDNCINDWVVVHWAWNASLDEDLKSQAKDTVKAGNDINTRLKKEWTEARTAYRAAELEAEDEYKEDVILFSGIVIGVSILIGLGYILLKIAY